MNTEQIKALFPLKAMVTQEILDSAIVLSSSRCYGALTLKSVLPDELKNSISWFDKEGLLSNSLEEQDFYITTQEGVEFLSGDKIVREVTFILVEKRKDWWEIN